MMKSPGTILVVDDSEDIRFLLGALLHSIGYESQEAVNGAQALEILDRDPGIRLVLTDFEMPVMDGLELTRRIRADERLEDLPVLLHSASDLGCIESRAASAGVTRLLPKPVNPQSLRAAIEAILTNIDHGHVWRALLIGLPSDSAAMLCSTLSDAGFQVLQAHDENQARVLLQTIDGIDLAFVNHRHPECGEFIRAHLLRTERDFHLFRLVLSTHGAAPRDKLQPGSVGVAGYLIHPISPEKVGALLRRLGLASIHGRH